MRKYEYSTRFKKDIKKGQKQTSPKRDMQSLKDVMDMLANDIPLPPEKRDQAVDGLVIENVTYKPFLGLSL